MAENGANIEIRLDPIPVYHPKVNILVILII